MGAARVSLIRTLNQSELTAPAGLSEQMSLNFPSADVLISATLPVRNDKQLIQDLSTIWGQVFSLTQCNFAWNNLVTGQVVASLWSSTDPVCLQQTFSNLVPETDLSSFLPQKFPELSWLPLVATANTDAIGYVGLNTEAAECTIPSSWTITTARLLQSAINWESQQTEQRLEALAEYAAGAGHEINNPLGTITGRIGQLLKQETDQEKRRLLELIGAQAYRVRDMIGDSMTFARPPQPVPEQLDLKSEIEDVLHRLSEQITKNDVHFSENLEAKLEVFADQSQLSVVISELILNAIHAVGSLPENKRTVRIDCLSRELNGHQFAYLCVTDQGAGFSEEEWEHCLNPFYSGRQAGRGLGFGLSKCWRIVKQHGGTLDYSRSESNTTQFHLWWPCADCVENPS